MALSLETRAILIEFLTTRREEIIKQRDREIAEIDRQIKYYENLAPVA